MVLSETGRLQLSGVIRGGLRVGEETRPKREQGLTVSRRLALEPERQPNRGLRAGWKTQLSGGLGADAQAACGFRCWTLKRSPFFHRVRVIAAILRARVRRASSGFIPWATRVV